MIRPFKGIVPRIDSSAFIAETAVIIGDVEIGRQRERLRFVPNTLGIDVSDLPEEGLFAAVALNPAFVVPQVAPVKVESGKFALVTGSALYHNGTLSQFGEGPMHVCPEGYVELSRADAVALKFAENDLLTVSSASGSMKLKARITPRMPLGVVFAPYHFGANPVNQIWSGAPVTWVTLTK